MTTPDSIFHLRATYSEQRLKEFAKRISGFVELNQYPNLTIYGAGSFGRLEASEHSDLDVFFLAQGDGDNVVDPRTKQLRLFARMIEAADAMSFPKFSNDCEYLQVLHTGPVILNLGGRSDDHANYFTARMLLLLEGRCIYGQDTFDEIVRSVVESYFKDFPDHQMTFQPMFLLNDISRFWKTLLLNYENKRRFAQPNGQDELQKTKRMVRNFKLKFSRMTTCFASIAALGSFAAPVTPEQVVGITRQTPLDRLGDIRTRCAEAETILDKIFAEYAWFLDKTALPTEQLEAHFSDKAQRVALFNRANQYGDLMYELLVTLDASDPNRRLLRTVVV